MRIAHVFAAGVAFLLPAAAPAQKPPNPAATVPSGDTERCAPGRWYTEGGNSARNGASMNAPVLRRPLVAWRQKTSGTIVGEPLVWDEHVVLGVRVADKRCGVEVRRLSDGSLVGPAPRILDSATDPWPALWGNEIVWRVGTDGLELLRIGKKSVDLVTRMPKGAKQVGPPLRVGTSVFAVIDGDVRCMRATDFRPQWGTTSGAFVGTVSLAGDLVYAVRRGQMGTYEVAALDRTTGQPRGVSASFLLSQVPGADVRMQIAGGTMLLRFGAGQFVAMARETGRDVNAVQVQLPLGPDSPISGRAVPLLHALDARWHVGAHETAIGKELLLLPTGTDRGVRLDNCDANRTLADAPPTLAGGVMYFGACAVDTAEYRVRWRMLRDGDRPLPPARAIPAGRTLLLAGTSELVALREDAPEEPVAAELQAAWLQGQQARCQPLVDEAIAANDLEMAADLLARCRELNVAEAWATAREKSIAAKAKDTKLRPDAAKAARVRAAADAVAAATLDEVHRALAGWGNRSELDRRQALRFVLRQSPDHAGAVAEVRNLLPKDVAAPEPFLAADWLDFLEATAAAKVNVLEAADFADEKDSIAAQNKQQLLEWRSRWRPDLKALQSSRLLLFSPITQPGSLAKALAAGELVCDALETMFADLPRLRSDPRPMLVFIYPDRDEYLAESKKAGFEDVEWTAGFYSDYLNELVAKSRLFVPRDDAGFLGVLPTFAHELTHQWLRDRCPAILADPTAARFGPKAFWIVEGFAGLLEQFQFDFARRRAALGTASVDRADLVASAHSAQLLAWDWLTKAGRLDFDRLRQDRGEVPIPSGVHLGHAFKASKTKLFYAQSAMLCRYLYDAEGGRYRKQLLDYVVAYYTGKLDQLDFAKAFGIEASDLAPKVVEYSRALSN